MQLWALIVDGLRESLDRKIFWVLVAITLVVVAAMCCIGFEEDGIVIMFGAAKLDTDAFNPTTQVGRTQIVGAMIYLVMDIVLGWIGVILMIVATAGMFPSMLQRGAIDVLLAKPLSRAKLFLYKYLAGLVFVFVQASLFIGLTFLVMGFRWHVWNFGYLMCVPLLVLLFSYLFCVSVFAAVRTGSTVAAVLISVGAWVMFAVISQAPDTFEVLELQDRPVLFTTARVMSWIPPKTGDLPILAARFAGAGPSTDLIPSEIAQAFPEADRQRMDAARQFERQKIAAPPIYSIGSSLLFEAVVLTLAMVSFTRKDY